MFASSTLTYYLLASADPTLLTVFETLLSADGACIKIFHSAEAVLSALSSPHAPALALLDVHLPGMEMDRLLTSIHGSASGSDFPLVMIADTVTPKWYKRIAEGLVDDLVPRNIEASYLQLRIAAAQRRHEQTNELKRLREDDARLDPLTGLYNRSALFSRLFDRNSPAPHRHDSLSVILFDIDDFGHWNERLGLTACDSLLRQVAQRVRRLLRSDDSVGRIGKDEFLVALSNGSNGKARLLAERLRDGVFSAPFHVSHDVIRLSACFGIASSLDRTPMNLLRAAEQALQVAKTAGPESIQCADGCAHPLAAPVAFLLPASGDQLLAW